MFEKVTYIQYSEALGRSVVPSETVFNSYIAENTAIMRNWVNLGIVSPIDEDGIDNAVCMMIEAQFQGEQLANGVAEGSKQSETIGGYSYSLSDAAKQAQSENFRSIDSKKLYWVEVYCYVNRAVI